MQMASVDTKRGQGDLRRAFQDGLAQGTPHGDVAVDVFDCDGGVVHQDADGQRQPAQRAGIERLPDGVEDHDGGEDGQRDGDGDDGRGAKAAQEQQNHQGR